jgi:hypothetical protein
MAMYSTGLAVLTTAYRASRCTNGHSMAGDTKFTKNYANKTSAYEAMRPAQRT